MAYGPPPQARDFIASWVEIGKPALVAGEEPEGRLERVEAESRRGASGTTTRRVYRGAT
jgi:hypothetical protein